MQRMSAADFRKEYKVTGGFVDARAKKQNATKNTRQAGSLCEDNRAAKVRFEAVQALSDVPIDCAPNFYDSEIRFSATVVSGSKADADNILKGAIDSLQGYAFRNDRQVREASVRVCNPGD